MDNVFDKYSHLLAKKTKRTLHNNFEEEEGSTKVDGKYRKTVKFMLRCKVRSYFDIAEAITRICKELDNIMDADSLAGSYKNMPLYTKGLDTYSDSPFGWGAVSYDSDKMKEYEIGAMVHVFKESLDETRKWYYYDFDTSGFGSLPFIPKEVPELKCVCGVVAIYGDTAIRQMHSNWCPMSKFAKQKRY